MSAHLKLARARLHLEALKYEIARFRGSHPYRFVEEDDVNTGEHLAYYVIEREPDDEMALILGDLANNLRSALDHAVWNLSLHFAAKRAEPIPDKAAKSIGFPVCIRTDQWPGSGHAAVRFLPDKFSAFVKSKQPYIAGDGVARMDDPLAILHALWNSDKHRTLVLATGWAKMDVVDVTYNGVFSDFYWSQPIVDNGSEVLRCPGGLHSKEHLETFLQIEVSLKEGVVTDCPVTPMRPIEEVATSMYQVVESIVRDISQGEYTIWLGELPPSGGRRRERYIPKPGETPPHLRGGLVPKA